VIHVKWLPLATIVLLMLSGCRHEVYSTVTIKVKVVTEYNPDTPTQLYDASSLPWKEVRWDQRHNWKGVAGNAWTKCGKYYPNSNEYQR
jgi:hypothetical protein